MGDKTGIEWTDATWTPIRALAHGKVGWHCEHVSEGCRFCYAERLNVRLGTGLPFKPAALSNGLVKLFLDKHMLSAPDRWRKPRRVFVCSMTDLFASFVPSDWIDRMVAVMARNSQHTFQVLTKRADRMHAYFYRPDTPLGWAPPLNVWLGVSVEDQKAADERIPHLIATPAVVRFLSCEPLLGPIGQLDLSKIDWVIAGGESGPGARPMHPDWARSLRDQCAAASVPFFMKQMSGTSKAHMPAIPDDLMVREFPA